MNKGFNSSLFISRLAMRALIILWATAASALFVNVTLSPLDTAFTYSPNPATVPHWTDSANSDGKVVRTGASEEGPISLALGLAGMQAITVYGETSAPGASLFQAFVGESEPVIPSGPFAFSYAWTEGGANSVRLSLAGVGAKINVYGAEVRLALKSNATSAESVPVLSKPFADTELSSFYAYQNGFAVGGGLVPVGTWSVAKGPDGEPAAAGPPSGRVSFNVPSNTSLMVMSSWSTKVGIELSLQLAPPPMWHTSGLVPMRLFAHSDGLVRSHVVLDPTVRYRMRIGLPSYEEKQTSIMLRDMVFWGATQDQRDRSVEASPSASVPAARCRSETYLGLILLTAVMCVSA
ncbi:hypothetical protein CspeluHIS016_0601480 [Cutaneotrichosporon spelunceum]|uniref:Uncharacterized protein n=1 Tax=Cutaneotrichosporon spelunceum TaxID=1672016 RepID=A0AAD3TXJ2_9TREE|nr:hypothetical protein CspeluHIS016_0601480 [Cutaneotrichosporon spelunceum]